MPTYHELVKKYQKRRKDTFMDTVATGLSYADNLAVDLGLMEDSAVLDAALDTMNSSGLLMFGLLYFRMQAEPIWGTNVLYMWW